MSINILLYLKIQVILTNPVRRNPINASETPDVLLRNSSPTHDAQLVESTKIMSFSNILVVSISDSIFLPFLVFQYSIKTVCDRHISSFNLVINLLL